MRKTKCFVVSTEHLHDLEQMFNKEVSKLEYNGWEVTDVQYVKERDCHSYSVIVVKEVGTEKGKKPFVKPEMVELGIIPTNSYVAKEYSQFVISPIKEELECVLGSIREKKVDQSVMLKEIERLSNVSALLQLILN